MVTSVDQVEAYGWAMDATARLNMVDDVNERIRKAGSERNCFEY